MLKLNFIQSKVDPCLFYKTNIVFAIYVDDTIFGSPNESIVDTTISELKSLNFDITYEEDVDSFLGVRIDTDENGKVTKSQPALIYTIIKLLGLDNNQPNTKPLKLLHHFINMKTRRYSMKSGAIDPY